MQEAVVNALVHRDYESDQPTRITIFSDRIEINSPGPLPRAINKELFVLGKSTPFWRNQTLAFFFNKLQLAQAEGQGIPTIIRMMREEGCPDPVFYIGEDNVICTLPAHPRHKLLMQLREIENEIVVGNLPDATLRIENILKEDSNNFKAIELYCEVCNLLKKPHLILNFLNNYKAIDTKSFPSSTLILMSETVLSCENDEAKKIADQLLNIAAVGRLEEKEIKKIAIGIRKMGNDEKAISFLNTAMEKIPSLRNHSPLLEIRAKAKIEMAKKCIETAKKKSASPPIKFRAWEKCREYLAEAEEDLNTALETATYHVDREFISNDLEFLNRLKSFAQKPSKTSKPITFKRNASRK